MNETPTVKGEGNKFRQKLDALWSDKRSYKKRLLMKKSLADFLLGLQDWEETGMDADLCSGFVART